MNGEPNATVAKPMMIDLDLSTSERGKTAADPFDVNFPGRKVGTLVQAFRALAWH